MPYYDRQIQLNKTLEKMCLSKHDNFSVVIVDDGSPVKVVLPELPFPVEVLRLGNEICTNVCIKRNIGFFYNLGNELLKNMPDYFNKQIKKTTQSNQTLEVDGVGINQFTHSLTESLKTLMKLQEETFMNV